METMKSENKLRTFFKENLGTVHVADIDGQLYFQASDIAQILGYSKTEHCTRKLDDDEKISLTVSTDAQRRPVAFISESGLYHAIFTANPRMLRGDAASEISEGTDRISDFRRWVTGTVIPTVSKDGFYIAGQETPARDTQEKLLRSVQALQQKMDRLLSEKVELKSNIEEQKETINDLRRMLASPRKPDKLYEIDYDVGSAPETTTLHGLGESVFDGVRTMPSDSGVLFFADDIASNLGLSRDGLRALDSDEVVQKRVPTNGGMQNVSMLTESGVYHAIFIATPARSSVLTEEQKTERMEKLTDFRTKVTSVVLPSIRVNGGYIENQEQLLTQEQSDLQACVDKLEKEVAELREESDNLDEEIEEYDKMVEEMPSEGRVIRTANAPMRSETSGERRSRSYESTDIGNYEEDAREFYGDSWDTDSQTNNDANIKWWDMDGQTNDDEEPEW